MFDVYVRVRLDALKGIRPSHLQSSVDQDASDHARHRSAELVCGFTEWVAVADRTLSVGWDWSFDPATGLLAADWETLRTNVMLLGEDGVDLGREQTRRIVSHWMSATPWQAATAAACRL
jgi:hypothetical protein